MNTKKSTFSYRHNLWHSPFSDYWLKAMSVRRMETPNYENSSVNGEWRTRENCQSGGSAVYKWLGFSFGLLCIIQSFANIYLWLQVDENSNELKNISTCNFTYKPPDDVRALILERDQLLQEKDLLNQKNKELLQNNNKLNQEKNQLLHRNSRLNRDKDQLNRDKVQLNRDKVQLNRDKVQLNRDKVQLNRDKDQLNRDKVQLNRDKDQLNRDKVQLNRDKVQLNRDKDQLNRDKVQLFQEKDRLLTKNRGLNRYTKQLLQDKGELLRENCQLKHDLNQLDRDKTELRNTITQLKTTNGILTEKEMMCNENVISLQNQLKELQLKLYMAQQNTPMCLPGWRRFKSGCYLLSSTSNTWEFARQDCESRGAHLVILSDKAEENFISSFGGAEKFWIGLKAENCDTCMCTWTWADGSSLCYSNWDNQEEPLPTWAYSCAYVAQSCTWLVGPCDENYYWICEKEL